VYKFIMPWLIAMLLGILFPWKSILSKGLANPIIAFIAITLVLAYMGYVIWFAISVKAVFIESDHLLVSNFFRSTEIPLVNIVKVVESKRQNWYPIVLGKVTYDTKSSVNIRKDRRYIMDIKKVYKGGPLEDRIEFVVSRITDTSQIFFRDGENYIVFIRSPNDSRDEERGKGLIGFLSFPVSTGNFEEVEAAIDIIKTYYTLEQHEQKKFLLKNLYIPNRYTTPMIEGEILRMRIKEAIPYFLGKLSQASTERKKLNGIAHLRCLGYPRVKETLHLYLNDDSFQLKGDVIEEMIKLNDRSLLPDIRKYVYDTNELTAVSARNALLKFGEPDAKGLLFDMIKKSRNPTVRYNAIFYMNRPRSAGLNFTDKEKSIIRNLINDSDPSIAREAGFIVEKWNPDSKRKLNQATNKEQKLNTNVVRRIKKSLTEAQRHGG